MQQQVLWTTNYPMSFTSTFMWHNTASSPSSHEVMFKLEVQYLFSVPSGISSNYLSHCASVQLPLRRG